MDELERHLVPLPPAPPPPGFADAVRRRARQRRRHQLTAASGLVTTLVVGVLVAGVLAPQTHSLDTVNDPAKPVTSSSPAGERQFLSPTVTTPRPASGAPQQPLVRPAPRPAGTPLPTAGPGSAPAAGAPDRFVVDVAASMTAPPGTVTCDGEWRPGPAGWCLRFIRGADDPEAPKTSKPDLRMLGVAVCRVAGSSTETVDLARAPRLRVFDTGGNAVLDSAVRWAGQAPYYGPGSPPTTAPVGHGGCRWFTAQWDTRDDRRELVPDGDYTYDFDLGDEQFAQWNAENTGPAIRVVYGEVH